MRCLFFLKKHNITVPSIVRKADQKEETKEYEETCHALRLASPQHMPSSLIMELPIIWLHLENHSLHHNLLMVQVFILVMTLTFELTLKFELKERVQ